MSDKESRTEDPTDKKLGEARKEGNIAKSMDLVAWGTILSGILILKMVVGKMATYMQNVMFEMSEVMVLHDEGRMLEFFIASLRGAVPILAPLMLSFMVLGVIGHIAQVRFVLATKAVKPKLSKLNPIKGFKRIFSKRSLVEAAKQLFKTIVICYIAYRTLYDTILSLTVGGPYSTGEVIRVTTGAVIDFLFQAAAAGFAIGVFDYFWQRKSTKDQLKMTKDEVKRESKEADLPPEVRGKMRQKAREMSRNRMMAAIPDADVVVVNPVHIAVALKYDPQKGAPKVIAKGAGIVAEKIRERAQEANVPLVQDIPLARTLHRICDIDDEIPGELFEAVAHVLAFVFTLKNRGLARGFHKMPGSPEMAEADRLEAEQKAAAQALADAKAAALEPV